MNRFDAERGSIVRYDDGQPGHALLQTAIRLVGRRWSQSDARFGTGLAGFSWHDDSERGLRFGCWDRRRCWAEGADA